MSFRHEAGRNAKRVMFSPAEHDHSVASGRPLARSDFAFLRLAVALLLVCAAGGRRPAAQADDLIQLNGDPPVTPRGPRQLRAAVPRRHRAPGGRHRDHGQRRLHRPRRATAGLLRHRDGRKQLHQRPLARDHRLRRRGDPPRSTCAGSSAPAAPAARSSSTRRASRSAVAVETAGTTPPPAGSHQLARPRRHADPARSRQRLVVHGAAGSRSAVTSGARAATQQPGTVRRA